MKVAIGDSFTYGEELADRELAWPALLSYTNLGQKGASNEYIFRTALEMAPKVTNMIIAWSDSGRYELYTNRAMNVKERYVKHTGIIQVNPGWTRMNSWFRELYGNYSDEKHQLLRTLSYMVALQDVLKVNMVDYYFCSTFGIQELFNRYIDNSELQPLLTRLNTNRYIGFPYEGMVEWAYDTPQGPNGHPLELGHKRIADKIAEYI